MIRSAARGHFPPVDGGVEVVPPYLDGVEAVVCFTGHTVVATRLDVEQLVAWGADGFGGAVLPGALLGLRGPDGELDVEDVLMVCQGTGTPETVAGEPSALLVDHIRVRHALRWRDQVRPFGTEQAMFTLARGLGGLTEISYEVATAERARGVGRELLRRALDLVPAGETVIAAAAPGNAASIRALLAAGFVPIGSVQLLRPTRP
jgi:hypothetical protein